MKKEIEKILTHLKDGVEGCKRDNEDLNEVSWNYQHGILISPNDAIIISSCIEKALEERPSDEEIAIVFKQIIDRDIVHLD